MKQNPNYILAHLSGKPYLLPFGQLIADHKPSLQLNHSGEVIWNQLKQPREKTALLDALQVLYDVQKEETASFHQDVEEFLSSMLACGVILDSDVCHPNVSRRPDSSVPERIQTDEDSPTVIRQFLHIAGLTLEFCGPAETFPGAFFPFCFPAEASCGTPLCFSKKTEVDQTITVRAAAPAIPAGTCLISHPQLCVYEQQDHFQLYFPSSRHVPAATLLRDGTRADFHVTPPYTEELRNDLFQSIRTVFLYLASQKDMYAIHSASICYHGKAWLFSGPSGTGKSTHTNLWKQYCGTPVINGDLNLLAFADSSFVIHGIPWCGTSGICDNHTYPLGGITLLKQASSNYLLPLTDDQKQLFVLQRLISPSWKADLLLRMVSFVARLAEQTAIRQLGCTVSPEAVCTIKEAIDRSHSI